MRGVKSAIEVMGVGAVGLLVSLFLEFVLDGVGFCGGRPSFARFCFQLFYQDYMLALGFLSGALILVGLILFFTEESIFRSWFVFTLMYVFAYVVFVVITPATGGFLQPQRDLVSIWLSIGFVAISLLLIAYKSWRLKKAKPTYSSGK